MVKDHFLGDFSVICLAIGFARFYPVSMKNRTEPYKFYIRLDGFSSLRKEFLGMNHEQCGANA